MLSCLVYRKDLALQAAGALEPSETLRLRRHLRACSRCREKLESLSRVLDALRLDPLLDRQEPVNWEQLREVTVARAVAEGGGRQALELGWALAASAAAVALVVALAWVLGLTPSPPPPSPAHEAFLERMEMRQAALEAASYLAESRQLLTGILSPAACARSGETPQPADVSVERERSRRLLMKGRLLEAALSRPELARARPVCEELDLVLVEIAHLPECAPNERLQEIERMVRSRDLLLKLDILAGESTDG